MRIPLQTYEIACDGCGEKFMTEEGFVCYCDAPDEIEDKANNSGWLITADGHHYCDRCCELNDNDHWETKDGRLYAYDGEPFNTGLVKGL